MKEKNKIKPGKKAEITWEAVVKIILALLVLVFLIGVAWMSREKISEFIANLVDIFRMH